MDLEPRPRRKAASDFLKTLSAKSDDLELMDDASIASVASDCCVLCGTSKGDVWYDLSEETHLRRKVRVRLTIEADEGKLCHKCKQKVEVLDRKILDMVANAALVRSAAAAAPKIKKDSCEFSSCVVCNKDLELQFPTSFRNILTSLTSHSHSPLISLLTGAVEEDMSTKSNLICRICSNLVERLDEVTVEEKQIAIELKHKYLATKLQLELSSHRPDPPIQVHHLKVLDANGLAVDVSVEGQDLLHEAPPDKDRPEVTLVFPANVQLMNGVQAVQDGSYLVDHSALLKLCPSLSLTDGNSVELRCSDDGAFKNAKGALENAEGAFMCAECGEAFKTFNKCVEHAREAHAKNDVFEDGPKRKSGKQSSRQKFKCEMCDRRFTRKETYLVHMERECGPAVSKDDRSEISTDSKLTCDECRKTFLAQEHLEAHKRQHRGELPFVCKVCGKGFTRKASMLEHTQRHKGIRDKECPICHKMFYSSSYWRHMSTIHATEDKLIHKCRFCTRTFPHLFRLRKHEKIHLSYDDREFKCEKCPEKRFTTNEAKVQHMRVVHSEKNKGFHLCQECGMTFSKPSNYFSHRRRHAQQKGTKAFKCSDCSLTFGANHTLKKHMEMVHGTKQIAEVDLHRPTDPHFIEGRHDDTTVFHIQTIEESMMTDNTVETIAVVNGGLVINGENFVVHTDEEGKDFLLPIESETQGQIVKIEEEQKPTEDQLSLVKCSMCYKEFQTEESLKHHVASSHQNEDSCPDGKSLTDLSSLLEPSGHVSHEPSSHVSGHVSGHVTLDPSGQSDVTCQKCLKSFKTVDQRKSHELECQNEQEEEVTTIVVDGTQVQVLGGPGPGPGQVQVLGDEALLVNPSVQNVENVLAQWKH